MTSAAGGIDARACGSDDATTVGAAVPGIGATDGDALVIGSVMVGGACGFRLSMDACGASPAMLIAVLASTFGTACVDCFTSDCVGGGAVGTGWTHHQPNASAAIGMQMPAIHNGQRWRDADARSTGIAVRTSGALPSRRSASDLRSASRINDMRSPYSGNLRRRGPLRSAAISARTVSGPTTPSLCRPKSRCTPRTAAISSAS